MKDENEENNNEISLLSKQKLAFRKRDSWTIISTWFVLHSFCGVEEQI